MDKTKAIQSVNEIKELMERSSKFVSLSGLTGVLVGAYSLIGSWLAVHILGLQDITTNNYSQVLNVTTPIRLRVIVILATGVLIASIITAFTISYYKARKSKQKLFNKLTYRLIWNFSIPLLTGGLFCIALLYHGHYGLTSSVMLLFYGMTLVNVSKYTFSNIGWLGYAFVVLGLLDCFFEGHGLLFWTLGFGVLHIIYGILFYFLYERNK
ncbi:hypothetical protein [Bacteroides sp. 51]|uniref:hypothetical protein n=1 Tax=Bacteroides sp. 51 TaxID=2302938 RepID=UPI0013D5F2FC|nr:hypothetical protein [Bacteroides sp. 51]NDV84575.1 hypothetical protein [Bacteroides sp. 51]